MIQLKRFKNNLSKDSSLVKIDDVLTINDCQYYLQGFIVHFGTCIGEGHYIYCYLSHSKNWVVLDDDKD